MIQPIAMLPMTVTAAAVAIQAMAALFNNNVDDDDVPFRSTSMSQGVTFKVDKFEVEATDSFHSKTSIAFMTVAVP